MSPEEKIEALKNMDRHGSEQDQKKIFNAQIQEKIFNAQMMKGEKKTFNVSWASFSLLPDFTNIQKHVLYWLPVWPELKM